MMLMDLNVYVYCVVKEGKWKVEQPEAKFYHQIDIPIEKPRNIENDLETEYCVDIVNNVKSQKRIKGGGG